MVDLEACFNFIQLSVGRMNFSVRQMVLATLICTCVTPWLKLSHILQYASGYIKANLKFRTKNDYKNMAKMYIQ